MSAHSSNSIRFLQSENVRLQQENKELREEVAMLRGVLGALRTLQEVTESVDVNTDALHLLDRILQSALQSITAEDGSLLLVDEETGELAFVVVHGLVRQSLMGYRIPQGAGIAGWVARNNTPVIIPDVRLDPRFSPDVDRLFQFHTRSILCVPIVHNERVMGVLEALNKANSAQFDEDDMTLLGVVAQLAATAMARAEAAVPDE